MTDETKVEKKALKAGSIVEDAGLLSEDTKNALRKKAREIAKKNATEAAEDAFLEAETKKAEAEEAAKAGITTNMEIIKHRINLGPSAKEIKINGMVYMHGSTYSLRKDVYDCIRDMEFRTHMHEDSRRGETENPYRLRDRTQLGGRAGFSGGAGAA